ncbi:MAG: sigma-54 dependent transcriptional regulator, partial [Syntrophus sp. (in: bacteria)]
MVQKKRKVLLSFNGDRDPHNISPKTSQSSDGPILTLLKLRSFDAVHLFFTPDRKEAADITNKVIGVQFPSIQVTPQPVSLTDPTSYQEILSELRRCIPGIIRSYAATDYYISLSSGTPHMHASWLLLVAGGEIPAQLLHVRDPKRIANGQDPLTEIDPRSSWFPHIAAAKPASSFHPALKAEDIEQAIHDAGIIGSDETIQYIVEMTAQAARTDETIMILGESGTGKEVLAQFIHYMSSRRVKKLVPLNCAAIPDNLVESELFGYDKGAFTGATNRKPGKFEDAHKGTLFLDEIGDMGLGAQVKILRAIQQKEITRLGGNQPINVDIRIIAATNRNLSELVKKGLFREDLYYRLNVVMITLPALKERKEDIPRLVQYFIRRFNVELKKEVKGVTEDAVEKLSLYSWPGNVRELENVVKRAMVECK